MPLNETEKKLMEELRHHLRGWQEKAENTFSRKTFEYELSQLESDPLYRDFGFSNNEYVLIRSMGRISISIGRRLGELYDKIPRFAVQAKYDLEHDDVALKMGPKGSQLNLDIGIPYRRLHAEDVEIVNSVFEDHSIPPMGSGYGIEIRYNFNPNDSSRLRKDVSMANYLAEANLTPTYLVFSSISPRNEAIDRLKRAGWHFLIGDDASSFMYDLCGLDVLSVLENPDISKEIQAEINKMYEGIFLSYGFKEATKNWAPRIEYAYVSI